MTSAKRWLLPDGVEEILPAEAHKLESLRRRVLDLYSSWGYRLVITPLIEFLDSLLVGTSHDLDIHTFKITDQLSGRMMGIRADMTPQAARIDAHCLNQDGLVRLCYADNALHTKPRGIMTSRVPILIGAELYGYSGVACDVELVCLMHETLQVVGIEKQLVVLGHVGIFRSLLSETELDEATRQRLFDAVQRKAYDEIDDVLDAAVIDVELREQLAKLTRMSGGSSVLEQAREAFAEGSADVSAELDELIAVAEGVRKRIPDVELGFDLCELRGYEYHTGIVFASYTEGYGRAVAKGGRYDHIGEVFGRARPASGFDTDLKTLAKLTNAEFPLPLGILAPESDDEALIARIRELRQSGEMVIINLGAEDISDQLCEEQQCDRKLVLENGSWEVQAVSH
jgi:ATP phosphoribosyltransferase regulatory subunit